MEVICALLIVLCFVLLAAYLDESREVDRIIKLWGESIERNKEILEEWRKDIDRAEKAEDEVIRLRRKLLDNNIIDNGESK